MRRDGLDTGFPCSSRYSWNGSWRRHGRYGLGLDHRGRTRHGGPARTACAPSACPSRASRVPCSRRGHRRLLPVGRGRFRVAWRGTGRTARRAAESSALAVKDDHRPNGTRAWSPKPAHTTGVSRPHRRSSANCPARTAPSRRFRVQIRQGVPEPGWISATDNGDNRDPSIGVDLPVRHGADAYALDNGTRPPARHVPASRRDQHAHSVITGHTGVADKALFTRLTELRKGDVFYVKVAAQTPPTRSRASGRSTRTI